MAEKIAEKGAELLKDSKQDADVLEKQIEDLVSKKFEELEEKTGHYYEKLQEKTKELRKDAKDAVQNHPCKALGFAALAGLMIGYLLMHK